MRNEVEKLREIRADLNKRLSQVEQEPQVPQPSDEQVEKYMVLQAEKVSDDGFLISKTEKKVVQFLISPFFRNLFSSFKRN